MKMPDVGRFTRTIRHLRSSQLLWRGRYAVARRLPAPHIPLPPAFDVACARQLKNLDSLPAVPLFHRPGPTGQDLVRMLAAGEIEHLNQRERIGRLSPDWKLGRHLKDRLWIVTLHYHHWLYDLAELVQARGAGAREAEELLIDFWSDWIARCDLHAPGARDLAWNAYAVATRIGWWVRTCAMLGREWFEMRLRFSETVLQSLWRQAEFVYRHVEWDLRGNHLLRDACGLAWAARLMNDSQSDRWMQRATQLALTQTEEQILPDGGHFERSPMYHLQVMEDVLTLASLLRDSSARESLCRTWDRMAEFASWMRHQDGRLPLLNDTAFNGCLTPNEMLSADSSGFVGDAVSHLTLSEPHGGRLFDQTGLAVWRGSRWGVFFDVGEIGPSCQPGHAHADSLTIECSVKGRRLFVDPGTFAYDRGKSRRYDRSTAAHNTVCIDKTDSSEVWHIFRVGARAQPYDVQVDITPEGMIARGSHDGYRNLTRSPRHTRQVEIREKGSLEIRDRIDGGGLHRIEGGYLLDPAWKADSTDSGWVLNDGDRHLRVTIQTAGLLEDLNAVNLTITRRAYHPEFGREIETTRLEWRYDGPLPIEVITRVEVRE